MTTRLVAGLPDLREPHAQRVMLRKVREGSSRFGFRLIEYSIQSNHLHMLVEVPDQRALTRGAKGLFVRLARALNRLWRRKGRVFAHRYHAVAKSTARSVRHALVYVLHNARKHGRIGLELDPYSSSPWFDGYRAADRSPSREPHGGANVPTRNPDRGRPLRCLSLESLRQWEPVTQRARTWLLARGWRRLGLIDPKESPSDHDGDALVEFGWRRVRAR